VTVCLFVSRGTVCLCVCRGHTNLSCASRHKETHKDVHAPCVHILCILVLSVASYASHRMQTKMHRSAHSMHEHLCLVCICVCRCTFWVSLSVGAHSVHLCLSHSVHILCVFVCHIYTFNECALLSSVHRCL